MKNIYFDNKNELNEFLQKHYVKSLGFGREGGCYLLDNNEVIKVLYDEYNVDYALQFKDINVDSFIFSKHGIIINNSVNALFMEYVKGFSLSEKLPFEQELIVLGNQLQNLVSDINKISRLGILVRDFIGTNIIYSANIFKIIDTTCYLYLKKYNYYQDNLRLIMNEIYNLFFMEIYGCRELFNNLLYLGNIELLENPIEYLKELKKRIEEIRQQEVITLEDTKQILKKMIKK